MNAALFTKSTTGLILASGLIAASSILGHAQDAPVALGTQATISLSGYYATTPTTTATGQATLGGHTFDLSGGKLVALTNGGSASFAGSVQNPTAVYLLLNTANTYFWYDGSLVGTVVLTFSDGTTQSADLTIGGNLREWRVGASNVVNTVTDVTPSTVAPYSTEVFATTALAGGNAVIDMLTVPVLAANNSKTLTGVTLNDTNAWGYLQMDLAGLTVAFTPPAPPTPQPTCIRPGNSCTTLAAVNSQADKWQAPTAGTTDSDTKHANNGHHAK